MVTIPGQSPNPQDPVPGFEPPAADPAINEGPLAPPLADGRPDPAIQAELDSQPELQRTFGGRLPFSPPIEPSPESNTGRDFTRPLEPVPPVRPMDTDLRVRLSAQVSESAQRQVYGAKTPFNLLNILYE